MNNTESEAKEKQISKPDGATAYFILNRNKKPTLRQRFHKWRYNIRKARAAKRITANPHTMDEVCEYIKAKHGFVEVTQDTKEYQEEYRETRAAFLLINAPELLGELKELPKLQGRSEEDIKRHIEAIEERKQVAHQVPKELFDIELHMFKKQVGDNKFHISIEKRYPYIGGGASGSTRTVHRIDKIIKDIYRYYGVTKEDIESKSKRYEELLRTLAR